MTVWMLVRHGETDWNKQHRIQGHADAPLNATGIEQARRLASRLAGVRIDAVYSSDVSRTRKTAEVAVEGRGIEVRELFDLRERNYGRWEGVTHEEWKATDPEGFAHWKRSPDTYTPPGGESLEEVLVRASRAARHINQQHSNDDSIVVVGHGASLLVLAVHLLGLPLSYRNNFILGNTSLSVLDVGTEHTVIHLWNDTSHAGGAW